MSEMQISFRPEPVGQLSELLVDILFSDEEGSVLSDTERAVVLILVYQSTKNVLSRKGVEFEKIEKTLSTCFAGGDERA